MGALKPNPASGGRQAFSTLAVTRIALANFRSYAACELTTGRAPVALVGPNGAGKTNLLEAISLLAPGRGLRGARLADHVRKGPMAGGDALWAVSATVERGGEDYEIGTGLAPGPSGESSEKRPDKRIVRLNGAVVPGSADLGDLVHMVWLTPAMDRLFLEGASARRRFLDRLALGFDAGHARAASSYETAMRERARLLKWGPRDPHWLDALEARMAESGILLAEGRLRIVARLNAALAARAGAFPCAHLALEGEDFPDAGIFARRLADGRMRDAEAGRTLVGPHLADLAVRHTEKRIDARDCSTGEQKALLISIVLADAWEVSRIKGAPLLLLDEVAAHLDARRRAALFEEILALGAQAWMTGTDASLFDAIAQDSEIVGVEGGCFTTGAAVGGTAT